MKKFRFFNVVLFYFFFLLFLIHPAFLNAQVRPVPVFSGPTATPTSTVTITATPSPTFTITLTPTQTLTPTITLSPTITPTPTVTSTGTLPTSTWTPTITLTSTITYTPTKTCTITPTFTLTSTATPGVFKFFVSSKPDRDGQIKFNWGANVKADEVNLKVYTSGFRLAREFDFNKEQNPENLTAGPHEITWDGKDEEDRPMPPGSYLCFVRVNVDKKTYEASGKTNIP